MLIDDLLELIKTRRSIRSFTQDPVTDIEINTLLEAARFAQSNSNRQAWKFLVVKNIDIKTKIAISVKIKADEVKNVLSDPDLIKSFQEYNQYLTFFESAPALVVVLMKQTSSFLENLKKRFDLKFLDRHVSSEMMSVSMAIQNIQLAAHAMQLGSCCMTGPLIAAEEIERILDVQKPYKLVALLPIGRYDQAPIAPERKNIKSISDIIE